MKSEGEKLCEEGMKETVTVIIDNGEANERTRSKRQCEKFVCINRRSYVYEGSDCH